MSYFGQESHYQDGKMAWAFFTKIPMRYKFTVKHGFTNGAVKNQLDINAMISHGKKRIKRP
jgi:hypothetical protein